MTRNIALDILKLGLAFMVVALHVGFLRDISPLGEYLIINGVFRIAVPTFLLINGFYFYAVLEKRNISVWFKRVFFLYIFWMLVYSNFWFRISDFSFVEFAKIFHTFIFGYHHLWYLPALLGSAALVVLLRKSSLKVMIAALLSIFIAGVLIQYAANYHMVNNETIDKLFNYVWFHRNFLFLAFPFFFIGFLINKFSIHEKISLSLSISLSVLGILLLVGESYFTYSDPLSEGNYDNLISLLIVSPSLFLVFMNLDFQGYSKQLALYVTGIYFIHPYVQHFYHKSYNFDETLLTFIVFLSSVIASYFLIIANKKFKFIL